MLRVVNLKILDFEDLISNVGFWVILKVLYKFKVSLRVNFKFFRWSLVSSVRIVVVVKRVFLMVEVFMLWE